MKININLITYIVLSIAISSHAMNKNIRRTAERILSKDRISHTHKQQKKLIESFSDHNADTTTFPDDFSLIISALSNKNTFPTLSSHEELLHQANEHFHDVPGFKELFRRIVRASPHSDDAHLRGALYELEVALSIPQQDSDETVIEFGKKIIDPTNGKTKSIIDLVTSHRWIECKDRSSRAQELKTLKTQIRTHQSYTDQYNSEDWQETVTYEVHFKNPIQKKLAQWLERERIVYVCPE